MLSTTTIIANDTAPHSTFAQWVISDCKQGALVLDVGAGLGNAKYATLIRPQVAYLVGIDPDTNIYQNTQLDEKYKATLEEFAANDQQAHRFDVIYAYCVVEHVDEPMQFFSGCHKLLRTGGNLFVCTPNLWHYFGMATKFSATIGLENWTLDRLLGAERRTTYHFPTRYRGNSIPTIKNYLTQAGYAAVEFKVFDNPAIFHSYLPKPLRWAPNLWSQAVYTLHLSSLMGTLMFKATA